MNSTPIQTRESASGEVVIGVGSKRSPEQLEEYGIDDIFVVNWEEWRAIPKKHGCELVAAYAAIGMCVGLFRETDV